jgi:hypothetical protein
MTPDAMQENFQPSAVRAIPSNSERGCSVDSFPVGLILDADAAQRGEAMAALAMFIHVFFHLCIGSFIFYGIAEVFYPEGNYPGTNY